MASHSNEETSNNTGSANSKNHYQRCGISLIDKQQWNYLLRLYRLSPRELEVASLVCRGKTTWEIAENLKIKSSTVKTHIKNILIKTRSRNKISFVLKAINDAMVFSGRPGKGSDIPIVDVKKKTRKTAKPEKNKKIL